MKRADIHLLRYTFVFLIIGAASITGVFSSQVHSADVTLAWDANTENDLKGYIIYYKTGASGPPYNGVGLDQGDSGIIIFKDNLDDPNQPTFRLAGLVQDVGYRFVVTALNLLDNESGYSNEVLYIWNSDSNPTPYPIADNLDANFKGTWKNSTWAPGYYDVNYQYAPAGDGSQSVIWRTDVPQAGIYDVYARWTAAPNRASNARYTIFHNGGNEAVEVDQRSQGGQWVFIGSYPFMQGTSGYVQLTNNTDNYVIADAVKWEPASVYPYPIVDNPDATFKGTWKNSTWAPGYYDVNYQHAPAGSGSQSVIWRTAIPQTGTYDVYARWTAGASRASNARYTIFYNGGNEAVEIDQRSQGGQWVLLGSYPFAQGTSGYVMLTDDADNYVIADAVMWEPDF